MDICKDEECDNLAIKDGLCRLHLWLRERSKWQKATRTRKARRTKESLTPSRCKVKDCEKPVTARGLCNMHYSRWLKHGDTNTKGGWGSTRFKKSDPRYGKRCSFEGCDRIFYAKNLCMRHWVQYNEGKPLKPIRLILEGHTCYAPGCNKPRNGKYCGMHASRLRNNGSLGLRRGPFSFTLQELGTKFGITRERVRQLLLIIKRDLSLDDEEARQYFLNNYQKGSAMKSLGLATSFFKAEAKKASSNILNLKLGESIFISAQRPFKERNTNMKQLPKGQFHSHLAEDGVWFFRVKEPE